MSASVEVGVRGDMIRLGQFLKLADAVDQGSDVKALLAAESVRVNGQVETRRGAQLIVGDVVVVGQMSYLVAARGHEPPSGNDANGS
ncbi:MAG: RNA-binding S4 domain-containing protein [Nocardioidaceae bacterium]